MEQAKLKQLIFKVLKADERLWNEDKTELNQTLLLDLVENIDEKVIDLLLQEKDLREKFFVKIKDVYVFKTNDFRFFMEENKVDNSYTAYKNRIGLTDGKKFLKDTNDVVLDFPYKDCVLEGGQSTEEGTDTYFEYDEKTEHYEQKQGKRKEIFFNSVLAHDEIDRLFDHKALTNWKRYTKDGEQEVKEIKRDEDGTIKENLIIKGNNLLALHSLKKQFNGKIKLIYIDPPYNTGNDGFKYNDNFNHSTWLTFMKNRLEVAKELLRDDGVIFVQCDDNEQAYLKVLMDEVFGRENSESVIWKKIDPKYDKNTNAKIVKRTKRIHEYIHIGFKNKNSTEFGKIKKLPNWKNEYNNIDNDPRGNYKQGIISFEEGHKKEDKTSEYYYTITLPSGREMTRHFFVLKDEFEELLKDNRIYFPKNGDGVPALKIFENEKKDFFFETILEGVGSLNSAKKEIAKLYNCKEDEIPFDTPKPALLLQEIFRAVTNKDDIVLDFHAGSGTTAHAILELNKEDDGNRKFIMIEQMDYINTVTCPRVQKVMEKENIDGSFIYFELAKWNGTAKEKILDCESLEELIKFFDEMYDRYFLNYNLKIKEFREKVINEEEFIILSLNDQKKMFIAMLDNNQMYVNKTEMADKKFGIDKEDQKLTSQFYNSEK
jgi:adenine-specific DNA-methyltransferase